MVVEIFRCDFQRSSPKTFSGEKVYGSLRKGLVG
jgi:hypothetical protein